MKTITIIDTFGFFFRSYFALPPLKNSDGFPTGLLTGFINLIDSLRRDHNTDYIVFALDTKGKTFRNNIYPEYKANRDAPPEDLTKQLPIAIDWIREMGFANLSKDGYEADDVIATVAKFAKEKGLKVRIVSHDKDLYQMIDDGRVVMYDSVKKREIDEQGCLDKFEVHPRDFVNFQAILGDSSDNVPGVKGIGQKGASKLINKYHTLEAIYEDIENCGTARVQKLLLESRESAFLSRDLVEMRTDIFKDFDWDSFEFEEKNYLACLLDDFERYEMKQAIKKAQIGIVSDEYIVAEKPKSSLSFEAITLDTKERLFEIVDTIGKDTLVAFDTETTGLDTKKVKIVGFSFALDAQKAYYVPIAHHYLGVTEQVDLKDAIEAIKKILQAKVIGQNLKFDLSLLYFQHGVEEIVPFADTMIMAWLLNPGTKVGLDALAKKFFKYEMKPFKEMVKKGETFANVDIESATFYAGEDAWMSYMLYLKLDKMMDLASIGHLKDEAKRVEYPFINILIAMEQRGIKLDIEKLERLQESLSSNIEELTAEIYALTSSEFNIKSTQQLGNVLFGHLGLKGGKRTKTGYSTNEKVLNSLIDEHEVIPKILKYRTVQKILSTYADPLLKLAKADKQSRVYTSFLQTGTATGRLSSREPNLQNIPVRSPLGRSVREAFVAKDGYKLLSIDYSQIELRLLAHFSQDRALLEAFRSGLDIHMATAVKLFGEEEAESKRSFAKSVNFGLLYGMGPKKLSDELGISSSEAKEIIKNYFASFPTVQNFLAQIQDDVKNRGFVETILKRRRIFDYESANGMQKAAFMRESVNTVFQGSAADLIKLSMIEIERYMIEEQVDGAMLLQIHDELIFEIEESVVNEVADRLKFIMENIMKLDTPLVCSVTIGNSWGELK
ncbi:DNA polymerase I [Sulfurovum sp. bin170]|uniref:DNA polymerase I n=1 Tax=Sulfurovum sp. bin170 TaxID=2695268 RepID=UPI00165F1C4C|nr:DNA polymerase I [Sulfurovum sp. bin170]